MKMMRTEPKPPVPELVKLLSYRRAHNSAGEKQYIRDFILPLGPEIVATTTNEVMAFIIRVGVSNIMFTSHVDSVHMNVPEVHQEVFISDGKFCKQDSQPLGADDAAGNWLMFHMIDQNVPGVYAFFRGEERGGIGSSYCAKNRPELFKNIDCAIAFDRKGKTSIITHQGMGRGCSDEFARSLARVIGLGMSPDPTGVYTDTAEFFDSIANCTNVSVGYENEHSKRETLDILFIEALRDALIKADWTGLDHTPPDKTEIDFNSYAFLGRHPKQTAPVQVPQKLFDDTYQYVVGPLDVADFLFDHSQELPTDLRDRGLALAQAIYKRFE